MVASLDWSLPALPGPSASRSFEDRFAGEGDEPESSF